MDGQPGIAGEGQPNVYCSVNTNRGYYRRPVISLRAVVLDVVKYKGSPMDQLQGGGGRQAIIHTAPEGLTQAQANGGAYHLPTGAGSWGAVELRKPLMITANLEQGGRGRGPYLCRRALLEYETGNMDEGQQYLERILEVEPLTVPGSNGGYALPAITVTAIARICGVLDHSTGPRLLPGQSSLYIK